MNATIAHIRTFLTVARFGSFTKAAHLLHLSQPALTVQVQQLEEALNLRLLDRNTRHVKLTRSGGDLVPVFQHLIHQFDVVVAKAQGLDERRQGVVRFASLPSLACTWVPEVMSHFRKRHPRVSFLLKDAIGRRIVQMVRSGEVEFGITDGNPNWPDLENRHLFRDEIHVVFPESHAIGALRRVTLDAMAEYPLILMDAETHSRRMIDEAFAAVNRVVMPACEVTYASTAIGMVRAGLGLAALTFWSIKATNVDSIPGLCSRQIDDDGLVRRISLIKKAGRALTPTANAFMTLLIRRSKATRL
ncbi:MAG: LysR family transcriptional regulator [Terriglobia bacterium]